MRDVRLLLAVAFAAALAGGCNIISSAVNILRPPQMSEPEFTFPDDATIVMLIDTADPSLADIKIIFDAAGQLLGEPQRLHLGPNQPRKIVAEVDPFSKGIDVVDFLD